MKIDIGRLVTVEAIQDWAVEPAMEIAIVKGASFEVMAEGLAIGFLRACIGENVEVTIRCQFDPLYGDDFGVFGTLFGIYLCFCSTSIFSVSKERGKIKVELGTKLWQYVLKNEGHIGDSKRQYVVFRDDDYLIPECIKVPGSEKFPLNNKFGKVLEQSIKRLGVSPDFGDLSGELSLVTVIYEAARNSYEHATRGSATPGVQGVRGIVIEKLIFANAEDLYRRSHSIKTISEFVRLNWHSAKTHKNAFIAITVCDLGEGIQKTLPGEVDEPDIVKLDRAIFTNATRKSPSDELERGLGLPTIIDAVSKLEALLLVWSSGVSGFADYSLESKYPKLTKGLASLPIPLKYSGRGTCLTILWPVRDKQLTII